MPGQSTLSRILYATEYQPDETATSMESELSVKVFHAATCSAMTEEDLIGYFRFQGRLIHQLRTIKCRETLRAKLPWRRMRCSLVTFPNVVVCRLQALAGFGDDDLHHRLPEGLLPRWYLRPSPETIRSLLGDQWALSQRLIRFIPTCVGQFWSMSV